MKKPSARDPNQALRTPEIKPAGEVALPSPKSESNQFIDIIYLQFIVYKLKI